MAKPYKIEHYKEGSALPKRVEKCRVRRNSAEYREFREHLIQRGNKQLSLREICTLMGIDVPYKFRHIADEKNQNLSVSEAGLRVGGIMFLMFEDIDMKQWLDNMVKNGAKVIFVDRKAYYRRARLWFAKYPVIILDDIIEQVGAVFSTIKEMNRVKTVALTGSVGKTTTNRLCNVVMGNEYNVVTNKGNLNSYKSIANCIFNELTPKTEVYIQEVGAANTNSVRKAGCMLRPDVFLLLNVEKHHMNAYGDFETLFRDKTSIDDYLAEDGVVIANYDDEGLVRHQFKHRVVSFGVHTEKKVDFRAVNIEQNNEYLEFDVIYGTNKTHLKIAILGKHNVYNALAAFALCKQFAISETEIAKGFMKYKSVGIRQNFKKIGDYNLLIDCYNSCEDSIKANIRTVQDFRLKEGGKKILVIAGENELGDQAEAITFDVGKSISTEGIGKIICYGVADESPEAINYYCHGRAMYEGVLAQGFKNVVYVNTPELLERELRATVKPGDMILFKGLLYINMAPTIDKVFGTSFSCVHPYYVDRSINVENDEYKARKIETLEGLDLIKLKNPEKKDIVIPDTIDGFSVHRIGGKLYAENESVETICFGASVKNIGQGAFYKCKNLETVHIPKNVKVIERGAFRGCENLKSVVMEDGVTHIGQNAFRANSKLEKVFIPKTVLNIETDAFKYSNDVTIICEKGSYAETYAVANSIEYKNI